MNWLQFLGLLLFLLALLFLLIALITAVKQENTWQGYLNAGLLALIAASTLALAAGYHIVSDFPFVK